MYGRITRIDEESTTILTEENKVIVVSSLFLPLRYKLGDIVEIDSDKIVLRWNYPLRTIPWLHFSTFPILLQRAPCILQ